MNTALTGRTNKIVDPSHPLQTMATGISLDQYLGGKIRGGTKLSSIECGVQVEPYTKAFAALSYRGKLQPVLPENSPYRVFDRLFRDVSSPDAPDAAAAGESQADRRRVLEAVSKDLEALRGSLPQSDRIKMEAHIAAVRDIEHSLTTGAGAASGNTCLKPDLGPPLDVWKNSDIPALAKLQMDLMAMAFACDLTRVGTIQFGNAGASHRITWLGKEFKGDPRLPNVDGAKGFHALAHRETDAASRAKLVKINTWYAQRFGYLLEKLASIPEAGGGD